jgi:hypothetical protein
MKRLFCHFSVLAVLFAAACDSTNNSTSKSKLAQDNAEKTIKTFVSTRNPPIKGLRELTICSFNEQSISKIEPLSQFADNEATATVNFNCEGGTIPFEFVFQKDVENHWYLTKFGSTDGRSTYPEKLKVLAQ